MSDSYLAPGKTATYSDLIVVEEGMLSLISIYTAAGGDLGFGPNLKLEVQDINLNFQSVSNPEFGSIILNNNCQQLVLATPGTYRIYRPDLSAWNYDVGIEVYQYTTGVPITPTPTPSVTPTPTPGVVGGFMLLQDTGYDTIIETGATDTGTSYAYTFNIADDGPLYLNVTTTEELPALLPVRMTFLNYSESAPNPAGEPLIQPASISTSSGDILGNPPPTNQFGDGSPVEYTLDTFLTPGQAELTYGRLFLQPNLINSSVAAFNAHVSLRWEVFFEGQWLDFDQIPNVIVDVVDGEINSSILSRTVTTRPPSLYLLNVLISIPGYYPELEHRVTVIDYSEDTAEPNINVGHIRLMGLNGNDWVVPATFTGYPGDEASVWPGSPYQNTVESSFDSFVPDVWSFFVALNPPFFVDDIAADVTVSFDVIVEVDPTLP